MSKADTFKVNLSLNETIKMINGGIVNGSVTGERIDYHFITGDDTNGAIVLVYEKHFFRAGNRLALTITIDNLAGVTSVHSIGSGGGQGLFKFDWGASKSFTSAPRTILKDHII